MPHHQPVRAIGEHEGGLVPEETVMLPEGEEPFVDAQLNAAVEFLTAPAASTSP